MCITGNAPAGTADPFGQVAGNCQKVLCDGNGGTTSVPDDTNVPTYANPCAFGSCSGGVPGSEQFHPNGTSCGAGEVCYGIDCLTGCYINGIYRSSGADEPGNTCQVCNPSVSTTAYVFVTDGTTCNDGNDCTTGDHCTSGVCGGTVSADGTACDQGNTCKSGAKQCASGVCNDTSLADGAPCQGVYPGAGDLPFAGTCIVGSCYNGCLVNGQPYPSSLPNPNYLDTAVCLICDPTQSTTSLYTGGCHCNLIGGQCDGAGVCVFDSPSGTCSPECQDCGTGPCCGGYCADFPKDLDLKTFVCTGTDACHGICNYGECQTEAPVPNGTSCGAGMTCTGGVCN